MEKKSEIKILGIEKFKNIDLENPWLKAPKGVIPVNYISATVLQMAARRNNVISITLRQI